MMILILFIGLPSGVTGVGGGVFLAPVILSMNWGTEHQTAAKTSIYDLMNSAAALLGAFIGADIFLIHDYA